MGAFVKGDVVVAPFPYPVPDHEPGGGRSLCGAAD